MSENKELRKEQDVRREQSGEPLTTESMMRDLAEEAEDQRTDEWRKRLLRDLLDLAKKVQR